MKDFVAVEVREAAEVEVVVSDEGVDERDALIKWRVGSGEWRVKVVVESFGEVGREGGLGGGADKVAFLKVEKRLTVGVVIQWLDAEMAGDSEEEGNRQ